MDDCPEGSAGHKAFQEAYQNEKGGAQTPLIDPVAIVTGGIAGAVTRAPATSVVNQVVEGAEKATARALNTTAGQFAFGFAQGFAKGVTPGADNRNVEAVKVVVPGVKAMEWGYKAGTAAGTAVKNWDKIRDTLGGLF